MGKVNKKLKVKKSVKRKKSPKITKHICDINPKRISKVQNQRKSLYEMVLLALSNLKDGIGATTKAITMYIWKCWVKTKNISSLAANIKKCLTFGMVEDKIIEVNVRKYRLSKRAKLSLIRLQKSKVKKKRRALDGVKEVMNEPKKKKIKKKIKRNIHAKRKVPGLIVRSFVKNRYLKKNKSPVHKYKNKKKAKCTPVNKTKSKGANKVKPDKIEKLEETDDIGAKQNRKGVKHKAEDSLQSSEAVHVDHKPKKRKTK